MQKIRCPKCHRMVCMQDLKLGVVEIYCSYCKGFVRLEVVHNQLRVQLVETYRITTPIMSLTVTAVLREA